MDWWVFVVGAAVVLAGLRLLLRRFGPPDTRRMAKDSTNNTARAEQQVQAMQQGANRWRGGGTR